MNGKSKRSGKKVYRKRAAKKTAGRAVRVGHQVAIASVPRYRKNLWFDTSIFTTTCVYNHRFVDSNTGLTTLAELGNSFRAGGPYDALVAIGGSNATGFFDYSEKFRRHQVNYCDVKIKFFDPSTDGLQVGYRIRRGGDSIATAGSPIDDLALYPHTRVKAIQNTGKQEVNFKFRVYPAKIWGITLMEYMGNQTSFGAPWNNVPSAETFIDVFTVNSKLVSNEVKVMITIAYNITFKQPWTTNV